MNCKKFGLKNEKRMSKMLKKYSKLKDINKTINSGAFWFSKGDRTGVNFNAEEFVIEMKSRKNSYRITSKVIRKLWDDAFDANKLPLFVILLLSKKYKYLLTIDIFFLRPTPINDKLPKTFKFDCAWAEKNKNTKHTVYLNDEFGTWGLLINVNKEII